jgi:aarF domain-containing kinase
VLLLGDLRNLRMLAEFLQRTELKFDILSSIKELQKNIHNEFDFINEAENIETMREYLKTSVPEVNLPRAIFASKRSLVMTFVKGQNLGKLDEFSHTKSIFVPIWIKQRLGRKILDVISKAWGEMIFTHQWFNSDPHPGNICLNQHSIGLLDWGQMKRISNDATYKFAKFVQAMNSRHQNSTADAFLNLGVIVGNPQDKRSIEGLAVTMLDTRVMHGFDMDPFSPNNALKYNSVKKLPTELYFLVRTVQLMRGIAYGFHLDYSLSQRWAPYAEKAIVRIEKARCVP